MEYLISSEKSKFNVEAIHDYLCHKSYWAKGRSLENVKKSIDNSICFGLYDSKDNMLGFARVVTDKVVFAYLMDLFILEEYQGKGLGAKLVLYQPDNDGCSIAVVFRNGQCPWFIRKIWVFQFR